MNKYQYALKVYSCLQNEETVDEYIPLEYSLAKDDLQELVERATSKKVSYEGDGYADGELVYDTAICPNCNRHFEVDYDEHSNFCPSCGQALDWSDEK